MFNRQMISLADIAQEDHPCILLTGLTSVISLARSEHGEPYRVPCAFAWGPGTAGGVTEIAERFENVPGRNLAFVP